MLFFVSGGVFLTFCKTLFWAVWVPPFSGFSGKFPGKFLSFFGARVRAFFCVNFRKISVDAVLSHFFLGVGNFQ